MGEAIALFIGSIWTSMTLSTAAVIAGAINGALIGAAIGGLTAAVTGGDIGKGMLYGAIGGAVTGGLSAWAGEGFALADAGVQNIQAAEAADIASRTTTITDASGNVTSTVAPKTADTSGILGMSDSTAQLVGQSISGVAEGYLSSPEDIDMSEQTASQMAIDKQRLDADALQRDLDRKQRMEELNMQLINQADISKADRLEQRRQYDVSATAAEARKQDASNTMGVLTIGQGTDTATYDQKINNVLDNELYENVAGV